MNWWMLMGGRRLMDAAGGDGSVGGGSGATGGTGGTAAPTPDPATAIGDLHAPAGGTETPTPDPATAIGDLHAPADASGKVPDGVTPPAADLSTMTDEDYIKAIKFDEKDEQLKGYSVDPEVAKVLAPEARKLGIQPEAASNLLALASKQLLAKQQAAAAAERESHAKWFAESKEKAVNELGKEGLQQVAAALRGRVRAGGFLDAMIRGGLGNDIEFLTLCRDLGRLVTPDTATGAGASGGGEEYDWAKNWTRPG